MDTGREAQSDEVNGVENYELADLKDFFIMMLQKRTEAFLLCSAMTSGSNAGASCKRRVSASTIKALLRE